jgi:hypothetical protein
MFQEASAVDRCRSQGYGEVGEREVGVLFSIAHVFGFVRVTCCKQSTILMDGQVQGFQQGSRRPVKQEVFVP